MYKQIFNKLIAERKYAQLGRQEMAKLMNLSYEGYRLKEIEINEFTLSEINHVLDILSEKQKRDIKFEELFRKKFEPRA